jgi:hypothetical protein
MKESLRAEYEAYLSRHGLKPRRVPSRQEREATYRQVTRIMYEEARARDDPWAEEMLIAYEKNRDRDLAETRNPLTIELEKIAEEIEATIHALPEFAAKFHDNVFVGEFPTGSVDCQTVKVEGGLLVLVSSGTLMMLQQVVTFLVREGGTGQPDSRASQTAADGVATVIATYLEAGDPVFAPKPLVGGMQALLSTSLSQAAKKFIIAHEYGHILAGHLDEPGADPITLETKAGAIDVLRKDHAQEFEADDIGYRLTLGVPTYEDFDLAAITAAEKSDYPSAVHAAAIQKCLIASPFVLLTIEAIIDKFREAARTIADAPSLFDTHPPAKERIERLMARRPGGDTPHSSFIAIPFTLLPSIDRILKVIVDHIQKPKPADAIDPQLGPADGPARRTWLDDILCCVEAIRKADYAAAALALTEAFEARRTIFEPDVDVVRRELVRAALGQPADLKRTILNRYRDRRMAEDTLKRAAASSPFYPGQKRSSLAMLSANLPKEKPYGLGLVKSVLDEETASRNRTRGEFHLLEAILCAWRGEREPSLSAFEAAIAVGVADPDGRLSDFVALEKRALKLGVPLGIEELLDAMMRNLLRENADVRAVAELLEAYIKYLDVPLDPVTQRMIDAQLRRNG